MKPLLLIIVVGMTAAVQGYSLYKKRSFRDLYFLMTFWGLSFGAALMVMLGLKLPNPSKIIECLIKAFIQTKFSYL